MAGPGQKAPTKASIEVDEEEVPYYQKRAIQMVGKHNLLHELVEYSDVVLPVEEKTKDTSGGIMVGDSKSTSDGIDSLLRTAIREHKSCHEYLLEYPEFSDDFNTGSKLDDTLDQISKTAFVLIQARMRRLKNDQSDNKDQCRSAGNVLAKMLMVGNG